MTAPSRLSTWMLATLAAVGTSAVAVAQEVPPRGTPVAVVQEAPAGDAEMVEEDGTRDLARLKRRLEESWRVVPLSDGVVLVPRRAGRDVRGVELRGETIALDGVVATGEEVRRRLGRDADAVLALSYLEAAERARLWSGESLEPERRRGGATSESPRTAEEWRQRGDRVRIGSDVVVHEGERVGEVVTIFGSSTIRGDVRGDVVAVFGNVRLEPTARVRGDVTSVGGRIDAAPGAQYQGGNHQVSLDWPHVRITPFWAWPGFPRDYALAWVGSLATFSRMLLVFLVVMAAVLLAPTRIAHVAQVVERRPFASLGIGLALLALAVPFMLVVTLALVISIVGIPLLALVPVFLVAVLLFWAGGFAGTVLALGRRLTGQDVTEAGAGSAAVGLALLWALTIAARLWWLAAGTASGAVVVASAVGATIEFVAWSMALGAAVLAWREGRRRAPFEAVVVPPPPPAPVTL